MRRRSFLTTLPLAAAGPALAQDASSSATIPSSPDAWVDMPVAEVTPLANARSRHVRLTGGGEIRSFGPAANGLTRIIRFAEAVRLQPDPANLILPNNGEVLLADPGDVLTAVALGGRAWVVTAYQPASVFTKVDRRPSRGGLSYKFGIGKDVVTEAPDFAVDGAFERTKVVMKSTFLIDPGDTPEIGMFIADGTAAAPKPWQEPYPGAFIYSWPRDATGNWGSPMDREGFQDSQWLGRNAQISFAVTGETTPTSRPGALIFGVCPPGRQIPIDRGWFGPRGGLVLSGRAVENALEAGVVSYPWAPRERARKYHPAPGLNWYEYHDDATLTLIASDSSDNKVLTVRRADRLKTGVAFDYLNASDEFRIGRVADGGFNASWSWTAQGHFSPAADRAVDLGAPDRRVRAIHADRMEVRRTAAGPAAVFESPAGEVVTLRTEAAGGEGFRFLRAVSGPEGAEDVAFELDGEGGAALHGALRGVGAGSGEFMEWADGNPGGEDRVGWAVVLEGAKIRRAGAADPPSAVIGVVTARAHVVGNAAWSHWSGKYLADDFGRPVTRPVEYLSWSEPVVETRTVRDVRPVKRTVERPRHERVEVAEDEPRLEQVDGRWVQKAVHTRRVVERPVVETVLVHREDGLPATNACGGLLTAETPVMEQVEIELLEPFDEEVEVEAGRIERRLPASALPAGFTPPAGAERIVVHEKVLNPAFDPGRAYRGRQERREWDVVSFSGQERVRAGERTGDRWVRLREVAPGVEEWLVR